MEYKETSYSYSSLTGDLHQAIQVAWGDLEDAGFQGDGSDGDDEGIIDALIEAGAPRWVRDAEGWTDEFGWGLIGPAIEETE